MNSRGLSPTQAPMLSAFQRMVLVFMLPLLAACSPRYSPFFWRYGEWVPGDAATIDRASTAAVDWSTLPDVITHIDGTPLGAGYKKARLAPGRHALSFSDHPAAFGEHPQGVVELDLLAGHEYEFRIEYCFWCKPRKYAAWVVDTATGQRVWGQGPDWPSWWL